MNKQVCQKPEGMGNYPLCIINGVLVHSVQSHPIVWKAIAEYWMLECILKCGTFRPDVELLQVEFFKHLLRIKWYRPLINVTRLK